VLSPLDDFPIHQVAEPIRNVGTSDRNFYDRYYFNAAPCSGETFVVLGMGQYPNLGTTDAFALVLHEGQHRVIRASRALGLDRMDTSVGPFRIEVVEGLKTLRFIVEPTEHDIAMDLTWEASAPPIREPRHVDRSGTGRIFLDACRLAQTGRWTGTIEVAGTTLDVTPADWWGTRDRSWGIRPSGESESPGIQADLPFDGFRWMYAPMQFEDRSIYAIMQERNDGSRVLEEAVEMRADGTHRSLGRLDYDVEWDDEERFVRRAQIRMGSTTVDVEVLTPVHVGVGTGYGFDAEWRHGQWHGGPVVQSRHWDLTTEEGRAPMWGIVDSISRFTVDGEVGYGLFEWMFL